MDLSIFSTRPPQVSFLAVADSAEDNSDLVTASDINPILDNGYPKSAGGLENILPLSLALLIPVKLAPLNCTPFYHGYGEECSNACLTIGVWNLPLCDLNGQLFQIPFYGFHGSGPLLLGNYVLHHSHMTGPEILLIISPEAGLALNSLFLQTYKTSSLRTRLHVVPCRKDYFSTFFSSVCAFTSSSRCKRSKPSNARDCRRFALRLHSATHLSLADMQILCKRSGVWTPALDQSLSNAVSVECFDFEACLRVSAFQFTRGSTLHRE
jgi:hypothetical protein